MLFNFKLFSRLYYFLFLIIFLTVLGTTGFYFIEDWNVIDSFYMTVITISTVGFSEVYELSSQGKIFTALLIIFSFGTFAYAVSSISNYLVGGEYKRYLKAYKISKKLNTMNNHVIICGFGRVGRQVAEDLKLNGDSFIVIENNEVLIEEYELANDRIFLNGDATNDEILIQANIQNAKAIITCLPKDADNLYIVLASREINPGISIVTRATSAYAVSKLKLAGANNVIMPDSIGGSHMASLIVNPDVMEFLEIIRVQGNRGANIESLCFEDIPEEFRYKTFDEINVKQNTGVTIIGYKEKNGEYIINPSLDSKAVEGSKLFFLGSSDQIAQLHKYFGIYQK